ncbi:hypothetical protein K440DRAFT_634572 [Wilcoxina mikolae CBS 423.85]|nr:hypothetical protein K440DRAFT_634572 [Wilcoxina mikolae CBS 423.85]
MSTLTACTRVASLTSGVSITTSHRLDTEISRISTEKPLSGFLSCTWMLANVGGFLLALVAGKRISLSDTRKK